MNEINKLLPLFAKANEFKEGDLLVGGTTDETVRGIARNEIADMQIKAIAETTFVEDKISEALAKSIDRKAYNEISHLRISELRDILICGQAQAWVKAYAAGLPSEAIAAVVKIMTEAELSKTALAIYNTNPPFDGTEGVQAGSKAHFGSRIQPNSPGDDEDEILLSILEGLCYGCGDVIIGLNPASDDLDTIIRTEKLLQAVVERFQLPTRYCVLSDMVKQKRASAETKVDVGFQSLSGTSKGLVGMLDSDADELLELCRGFNGLYFETGQGSEVTNGAAQGVDMVTLEARCYGLARYIKKETGKWMIVNDVAGFIGPEVFTTGRQLRRTCLEDIVMAKLHGLVMGLDVCSTFHMGINPAELKLLTKEIVSLAAPAYMMAVAGNADPMLGYLTTSYREHPQLRRQTGKQITSAMQKQLVKIGALKTDGTTDATIERTAALYARFYKSAADSRSLDELEKEAVKKIKNFQERGCDLGYGADNYESETSFVAIRCQKLFDHSRKALYAVIEPAVIKDCCPVPVFVLTESCDRDDFLAHPASGERLAKKDAALLENLTAELPVNRKVQFVVSDGLNANAVSEHLRNILPLLKRSLNDADISVSPNDIVVTNGRVRAGYHVGQLLRADIVVNLIGERPGTGLNQLSAYITYGKDVEGFSIFDPDMDHSLTTAVCSIHPQGKTYKTAADEILSIIMKALEMKKTGVGLGYFPKIK